MKVKRFYYKYCGVCGGRLRIIDRDTDDARRFYICPRSQHHWTYLVEPNGMAPEWPKEIFDRAVERGLITREGRLV